MLMEILVEDTVDHAYQHDLESSLCPSLDLHLLHWIWHPEDWLRCTNNTYLPMERTRDDQGIPYVTVCSYGFTTLYRVL